MSKKYPTAQLIGVVMQQNSNGQFVPEKSTLSLADFHSWRVGKHTKGKLGKPGQLFLTENQLTVMLVIVKDLGFNDRHQFATMGRFLQNSVDEKVYDSILSAYNDLISNS
ncbi:hypothetical protein H9L19_07625 [Weissella diestrammenae]|uniref:DUF7671 domain-containing protein n=1 Tax=Weissella diestrammenae TaxID=1162633 RepID=A0A7G9T549_9LACO|nr:hypothetical protein [Weissella diestrammenae]MCM0583080.1 hypothetical protein [Weissella diestrammenae]QNN75224.1 hypothetical protein H9L19_07625 [Weissella diestrammenae]